MTILPDVGTTRQSRRDIRGTGRTHDRIDERLAAWIADQPVFFVATAPLAGDGHVNCSPKGNRGEFVVLE